MSKETAIEDVLDACLDPKRGGVIDLRARRLRGTASDLRSILRKNNFHVAEIDAENVSDERSLMEALARGFRFPGYFGFNWDAVDECLMDLDWLEATRYCCIVSGAKAIEERAPRGFRLLRDVFSDASDYWEEEEGALMKLVLL